MARKHVHLSILVAGVVFAIVSAGISGDAGARTLQKSREKGILRVWKESCYRGEDTDNDTTNETFLSA
jgi:hypothetical protein